jgi:hypothetical protein
MTSIDLDTLRTRWSQASDRLDANLHLDVAAMRAGLAAQTRRSVRWQFPGLLFELLLDVALVLALTAFVLAHLDDALYLASGLLLLAFPLAALILGVVQWRAMTRLDYTLPVQSLRMQLDTLRRRRVRLAQFILYGSVPLWWPAVAVGFKGLFGADLLRGLPASIFVVSFVAGAAILVFGLMLGGWIARRYGARPGYQDFLDDVAGMGWRGLRGRLEAQTRFESDLDAAGAAAALQARCAVQPLPADVMPAMVRLRRRLLLATFFYAGLILLNGTFNATHGGEIFFIVPGVLLNFAWVAQMVAAILVRIRLAQLDANMPRDDLQRRVASVAGWSASIAQRTLVLAPVIALPLAQVLGKAILGINLATQLGLEACIMLGIASAIASLGLLRRYRQQRKKFAARGVHWLSLGAAGLARALADRLGPPNEPG